MVFDSFKLTSLSLKNEKLPSSSDVLDSLWIAGSSPSFHGNFLTFSLVGLLQFVKCSALYS